MPSPLTQVGPYRVERELGRGGRGEVYLATDTRPDRQVAIQALPAHLAKDPDRLARFQRETKVLAWLNHPGLRAILHREPNWTLLPPLAIRSGLSAAAVSSLCIAAGR